MSALRPRLCLLFLISGAALSCVEVEKPKNTYCQQVPATCFSPIFLSLHQEEVRGEDAVIFRVAARDPSPDRELSFEFSAEEELGLFEPRPGTPSTGVAVWNHPSCIPRAKNGSHDVLITVTAKNPQGFTSINSVHFEIPLACPEWTLVPVKDFAAASHTATRLKSGRVLVAGGLDLDGSRNSSEIYGPISSSTSLDSDSPWAWAQARPMNFPRAYHAGALMDSGKVLITGGKEVRRVGTDTYVSKPLCSVEVYDPYAPDGEQWSATECMGVERERHTATLLDSGNVLVVGGLTDGSTSTTSSEEYSPETQSWSPPSYMFSARAGHTATLLPGGDVLVIGGFEPTASAGEPLSIPGEGTAAKVPLATAERYSPLTQTWRPFGAQLKQARYGHTATLLSLGKVLITGGFNEQGPLASSEIFDPATEEASPAGDLLAARGQHTAVLLDTGQVLVAGGRDAHAPLSSTELFTSDTLKWSPSTSLHDARDEHSATLLFSGDVLVTGGVGPTAHHLASTELYPSMEKAYRSASWSPVGDMITAEAGHTATKLPSGKVLVAGGYGFAPGYSGAMVYSPSTNTWLPTAGNMVSNRDDHTATLLPSGKVLVAGGDGLGVSELYDPGTDSWSPTGDVMGSPRELHTATLLPSGKVLVAGGDLSLTALASAEFYDPATGLWSPTGDMTTPRERHTATLLPSGKVLVAGGAATDGGLALDSAELYDPATGTWTATTSMPSAALLHSATLLSSGKVLIAGGTTGGIFSPARKSAVLYDPVTETWSPTGDMNEARNLPTATLLLPPGEVFVTGGDLDSMSTSTAELYDPATGVWTPTVPLFGRRINHTATLLSSGDVLVTGGYDFSPLVSAFVSTAEVYLPEKRPPESVP